MRRETGMQRRSFLKSAGIFAALGAPNLLAKEKDRPDLTLGVISDTHIGTRASAVILERTLDFFHDRKVDAVMICGDLADWGLLSGLKYIAETWEKVFPHGKGAGGKTVQKLFCTGNHDYEGWWYGDMTAEMHALGYDEDEALVKLGMKKCWEEVFQEAFAPIRKRTVNGFDFISAEWYGYDKAPGYDMTADWFKSHGGELDPARPFFFFLHQPPAKTTASSWDGRLAQMVTDTLSAKPNAVAFSGHSHWTLNDERSIWQGAFTAVSVPSAFLHGRDERLREWRGRAQRQDDACHADDTGTVPSGRTTGTCGYVVPRPHGDGALRLQEIRSHGTDMECAAAAFRGGASLRLFLSFGAHSGTGVPVEGATLALHPQYGDARREVADCVGGRIPGGEGRAGCAGI